MTPKKKNDDFANKQYQEIYTEYLNGSLLPNTVNKSSDLLMAEDLNEEQLDSFKKTT